MREFALPISCFKDDRLISSFGLLVMCFRFALIGDRAWSGSKVGRMRPAKYTVDVGVQGMREVFRRVFLRPMQWA